MQFKEQKEEGYKNIVKQTQVHSIKTAQIQTDITFDIITVKIIASE